MFSNRFQLLFLSFYHRLLLPRLDIDPFLSTTGYNPCSRTRTEKYGFSGTRRGGRPQQKSSDIERELNRSLLLVLTMKMTWVTIRDQEKRKPQLEPCLERRSTIETTEVCTTLLVLGVRADSDLCVVAIRLTLDFYQTHLNSISPPRTTSTHPSLVLLTDDRGNREKAVKAGFNALSTREYVDGLTDELTKVQLGDLVAVKYGPEDGVQSTRAAGSSKRRLYPEVSRLSHCEMGTPAYPELPRSISRKRHC
jgi:hypothetical protein